MTDWSVTPTDLFTTMDGALTVVHQLGPVQVLTMPKCGGHDATRENVVAEMFRAKMAAWGEFARDLAEKREGCHAAQGRRIKIPQAQIVRMVDPYHAPEVERRKSKTLGGDRFCVSGQKATGGRPGWPYRAARAGVMGSVGGPHESVIEVCSSPDPNPRRWCPPPCPTWPRPTSNVATNRCPDVCDPYVCSDLMCVLRFG